MASLLLVCLLRLAQMQLLPDSSLQDEIAELKRQRSRCEQLKTIRGKILDRKGRVLAADVLQFHLCINYRLSRFADERIRRAKLLTATKQKNANLALLNVHKQSQSKCEDLQRIIEKCTYFGLPREIIKNKIEEINDRIWNLREYLAWKRNFPDSSFVEAVPDANERLLLTAKVDITEMHKDYPLLELRTDDDIFAAQVEFMDVDGVQILPKMQRFYPHGPAAAQTIGWVGSPQEPDKRLFANDRLAGYLGGEVCGREDGVEYVCEIVLRGRRGEVAYDIDHRLISQTESRFGKDVQLSLDIELQKKIENYLADCKLNPNCKSPTAAVVIDVGVPKREKGHLGGPVATGDILALLSMPNFDLNRVRYDYEALASDPNEPLRNRAINKQYPPGSVVKPLILIAGLESGEITADEIIHCPAQKAPRGWPSCWLYNKYPWTGHDDKWLNSARNAIKGSCNIYFSRLADRIDPSALQQWLLAFGYGQISSLVPHPSSAYPELVEGLDSRVTGHGSRQLRQAPGIIASGSREGTIAPKDRRYFGIGQGNLRATALQVANSFAAIARGGLYKLPRLFLDSRVSSIEHRASSIELGISPQTLAVIYDGTGAVVNEPGGTAYKEFAPVLASFTEQGIMVYGKTGSTEEPDNAWFAGFAKDSTGRAIAIAVIIEGGQHGSSDAAPIGRDIIQFCIEAGYIGGTPR